MAESSLAAFVVVAAGRAAYGGLGEEEYAAWGLDVLQFVVEPGSGQGAGEEAVRPGMTVAIGQSANVSAAAGAGLGVTAMVVAAETAEDITVLGSKRPRAPHRPPTAFVEAGTKACPAG